MKTAHSFSCLLMLLLGTISNAQQVELSAGMGLPETPHVALRYVSPTFLGGASYGFLPSQGIRTINFDVGVPYGKPAKNADAKKSQFRIIFNSYREESDTRIFKNLYLVPRAGRNYFFSQTFGLSLEGGFAIRLVKKTESKDGTPINDSDLDLDSFLPSASLRFFARF